jgi:SAM-dependent methyltransferase
MRARYVMPLLVPFLGILTLIAFAKYFLNAFKRPRIGSLFFDGLGKTARAVRDNSANWRALDIIYNYRYCAGGWLSTKIDHFWHMNLLNTTALRNRLRLTRLMLIQELMRLSEITDEVRVLSIACGSAQAIIEAAYEIKTKGIKIKIKLLDLDQSGLAAARSFAIQKGVDVELLHRNASNLPADFLPHLVEVVGFLDYRPHPRAVALLERIYRILAPSGVVVTCNIHPNPEQWFVRWVINWWMIYRRPSEVMNLLLESGFIHHNIRLVFEPLKVYLLAVARKPD